MSIVNLQQVDLIQGGQYLLDKADWQLEAHDRVALVGRNGAGKSSLLRLLSGLVLPDAGQFSKLNGLRIAGLTQDVPIEEKESVYHFIVKDLGPLGEALVNYQHALKKNDLSLQSHCQQQIDHYQGWDKLAHIDVIASRMGVDLALSVSMQELSGGMKRRVLLLAALLAEPDLLLLDEPTNHLDIAAIEWLEAYLKNWSGTLVVVTHDRQFLSNVATKIVEIDRGKLYDYACDYENFLIRREDRLHAEERHHELFDKRLKEEEAWIRTGIKARRTRNEGRVRALKTMRDQYKARRQQVGNAQGMVVDASRSGLTVIEAKNVNYSLPDKPLINNLSLLLTRGDKLGIVGPNGCGKTTLIRLLLGELKPDSGSIKQGSNLAVAYFDQLRRQLNEQESVMTNVADGSDHVVINGKHRHVATYLREFLFPAERLHQPVSSLSGGEKNRLLLAKLLAKPVNLLIMDEPTNDLDIETLELLEEMLINYQGTLVIISHDRAFINQVVTSLLVYEGDGQFVECIGDLDDYRRQQKQQKVVQQSKVAATEPSKPKKVSMKLSYNEQRELAQLPQQIESLEREITEAHERIAASDFYQQSSEAIAVFHQALSEKEQTLSNLYDRWAELEAGGKSC